MYINTKLKTSSIFYITILHMVPNTYNGIVSYFCVQFIVWCHIYLIRLKAKE